MEVRQRRRWNVSTSLSTTDSILNDKTAAFACDPFVEETQANTEREPEDGRKNTLRSGVSLAPGC